MFQNVGARYVSAAKRNFRSRYVRTNLRSVPVGQFSTDSLQQRLDIRIDRQDVDRLPTDVRCLYVQDLLRGRVQVDDALLTIQDQHAFPHLSEDCLVRNRNEMEHAEAKQGNSVRRGGEDEAKECKIHRFEGIQVE